MSDDSQTEREVVIPSCMSDRTRMVLEAANVRFVDQRDDDGWHVVLPIGWKLVEPESTSRAYLMDEKGSTRATIEPYQFKKSYLWGIIPRRQRRRVNEPVIRAEARYITHVEEVGEGVLAAVTDQKTGKIVYTTTIYRYGTPSGPAFNEHERRRDIAERKVAQTSQAYEGANVGMCLKYGEDWESPLHWLS